MKIVNKSIQNLFDIALILYGDISNIVLMCKENNISIDETLKSGDMIESELTVTNVSVKEYYNSRNILPAQSIDDGDLSGDFNEDFSNDFLL